MGRLKDLLLQENLDLTTITTSKAEARRLWHHLNTSQLGSVADDKEPQHALVPQQPA